MPHSWMTGPRSAARPAVEVRPRAAVALAVAALSVSLLATFAAPAHAIVPFGFADDVAASGFTLPVAFEFDPAGRLFVAEKSGLAYVVDASGATLPTPLIDLRDDVHAQHDKGMLDLALDPDYGTNGFVYFLYNVDPVFGEPDEHAESATWGRVVRYTVVGDTCDTSTRQVIVGHTAADGIANCYRSHAIGTIDFGHDGSLFVGSGDGAHYNFTDGGQDVTGYDPECAAVFGSAQDLGALRSQLLNESLAGRILRVDRATGQGLPDNPFWDGDPDSYASKSFNLGLRNPFRFSVRPASLGGSGAIGTLYIGDVGAGTWEELNVSTGGENFGWPCFEGPNPQGSYQSNSQTSWFCAALAESAVTPPTLPWHHSNPGGQGFVGNTTSGGVFYTGTSFPVNYHGRFFFSDYGDNWIRVAEIDSLHTVLSHEEFATGLAEPVDLKVDPATGDLLYVSITQGTIRRVSFTLGNVPPVPVAGATPTSGPLPLDVQFSSDGTYDPNGDPFTLRWEFGDGSPASTDPNPLHTYTTLGTFDAWLVAEDDSGNVDSTSVQVQTLNLPPTVAITNPLTGYVFEIDEEIPLQAAASDPEDGTNLNWNWTVDQIHNDHPHPGWFSSVAESPTIIAEDHGNTGDRFSYRIRVTVTDQGGASASDTTWIVPETQGPNAAPIADFSVDVHEGAAPLAVQFDATPSVDPNDDLMLYDWDFGDGTTGSGLATTHIFGAPGLYTVTLTVQDPGLATGTTTASILVEPGGAIAHWRLDDGAGGSAADASGNNVTGTVNNASWVPGLTGSALDFNGTSSSVTTGQSLLSNRSAFTIAGWVYPRSTGNRIGLFGQNNAVEFGFISTGNVQIWTPGGGSVTTPWPHPMAEWHHLAAVGDGSTLSIWIDGAQVASAASATSDYGSSGDGFNLGGDGIYDADGNWFDGILDDVRVYATALDQTALELLATAPPTNAAPSPDAGPNGDAIQNLPFALIGDVTDDGLPAPPGQTDVTWSQLSGPGTAVIFNAGALFSQVIFPEVGTYELQLLADDGAATSADTVRIEVADATSAPSGPLLGQPGLRSVSPNPLRGQTTISYVVSQPGLPTKLTVHSVDGRQVARLADGPSRAGLFEAVWNGRDAQGSPVASGVYFVVAEIDGRRTSRKVTVLR